MLANGRRSSLPLTSARLTTLLLAVGLTVAGVLWAPPPALSWGDGAFSAASEQELIARTNRSRVEAGLTTLRVDAELTAVARWRSRDMSARGYFSHAIPPLGQKVFAVLEGREYCFTLAGENIGWNTHSDALATERIHQAFLDSPGHRANVVAEPWRAVGVGAYKGPDGKKLWTVLFADPCRDVGLPRGS
jgi:uncharacterized protein YkwD